MRQVIGSKKHSSIYSHYLPTAPSGPPTSVTVTSVTASSISIQWEEAACLQRNGLITGYIVLIKRDGEAIQTVNVDSDARETTTYGLTPSTQFSVSVAAINGVGTGPSTDVTAQTESESSSSYIILSSGIHSVLH